MIINNTFLYLLTVLIWGTTWYAIKLQVLYAPIEMSIFYRAALSSLLLGGWCWWKGISLNFSVRNHFFICLLGICMFSVHYLFVYKATNYLVSGIIALIFSAVSFFSIVHNFLFFGKRPPFSVVLGTFMGMVGLGIFFWDELLSVRLQETTVKGIVLAGIGTVIFSLGSAVSKRNNSKGLDVLPTMTLAMIYGSIIIFLYMVLKGSPFIWPTNGIYWVSLFHLVLPGSIIAFLCYLHLIKNLGPEYAGYTTILFPMVALLISWGFEGYSMSLKDMIGMVFVGMGNIMVMRQRPL